MSAQMTIWSFFAEHRDEIFGATLDHLTLVVIAMLIAILIGVPLGMFIVQRPALRTFALGIASIKATLVILFFMHGKYSSRRTKLVIVCGFFWLAIMLGLTLADYSSRHAEPSRSQSRPAPVEQFV